MWDRQKNKMFYFIVKSVYFLFSHGRKWVDFSGRRTGNKPKCDWITATKFVHHWGGKRIILDTIAWKRIVEKNIKTEIGSECGRGVFQERKRREVEEKIGKYSKPWSVQKEAIGNKGGNAGRHNKKVIEVRDKVRQIWEQPQQKESH